jgi:hypothetical protein
MRPSALQRAIMRSYDIFFERAFEIETRPQRRMRLKSYAKSVEYGRAGMERHAMWLEGIEKPYYTPDNRLREELLESDFESRHGRLRNWLGRTVRADAGFARAFAQ